ncbi:hypothetical protein DV096_20185 [Bradymonadaceae bacterium TMQ3]|uniref:Histidine kinase n=1 Tax=Lujinxingia sediminis TaxID=2480984 RepID=A0ABY0CMW0_9DELT|nr:histidine kinase [Lujinxingia sediminis]RDV36241.1 hypothetical protein DV096_20185 [Bradymonadaceae bacterium TMQ3]RVU40987.1 hypothetical protein EA187_19600 [Lujinxingia sediminis]TXC67686.1 hypothetical protein FRC91_19860 [Bradymonadales bacterium TMQ1]
MEALHLVLNLLEKVSVLVALALSLLLLRPAEVWLSQRGAEASVRRRLLLVLLLSGLAIWGSFLGFEIDGMQFNIRSVGVILAGYLGGVWVGLAVGAAAGVVYAMEVPSHFFGLVFAASLLEGALAGLWSRRFGTAMASVALGAIAIQAIHHAGLGAILSGIDTATATFHVERIPLHSAKIAANAVGILLFMGMLSLVRELELARRDATTSRAIARDARLEALQYQLKPHFLFNVLNTLSYLIRTDAPRARELTLDLAEFLRYTLANDADQTTLDEELEQLRRYVDLERARFGEGLHFEIDAGDALEVAEEVRVPPLIVQPLVENAFRHAARQGRVSVCVELEADPTHLHIRVLDDGPSPPATPWRPTPAEHTRTSRGGVGLTNVFERLSRFYNGQASLSLHRRDDAEGTVATITIPRDASPPPRTRLGDHVRKKLREVVEP